MLQSCMYWQYPVFPTGGMPQEGETKLPAKDIEEMKKQNLMKPLEMEELAEAQLRHITTTKG